MRHTWPTKASAAASCSRPRSAAPSRPGGCVPSVRKSHFCLDVNFNHASFTIASFWVWKYYIFGIKTHKTFIPNPNHTSLILISNPDINKVSPLVLSIIFGQNVDLTSGLQCSIFMAKQEGCDGHACAPWR